MSFQGIRKIREGKRESPVIFESEQLPRREGSLRPMLFNFEQKFSNACVDIRTTRDSQIKGDSFSRPSRKSSFAVSSSQDKNKQILVDNFLPLNLEGIRNVRLSKQIQLPKTDRVPLKKNNTEDYEREISRMGLHSFTLEFVVGKGGFGKVWKVREKASGKMFAMKEMQKVKIVSKRSVHSVMNEKILLQKLKSPFLVNMVHSFQNRENLFLVMDYCNRGDLRYHLGNRRKFREDETKFFMACIVLALQYLHSKKVIHRDLKPQNLVIDDRGYVRLTDLGVSREVKPNNEEDTSGTPGYMSPEVICKKNHSYPVDFFALGVIAYEFMAGKRPYIGQNRKQIREKILQKQVQVDQIPPFGWSKESVDFINRLIQRNPQNRLGTNGIQQVKQHPFFRKVEWNLIEQGRLVPPFLPPTIEEDYINYKECISEDTEIQDAEEYKMILRHKDTQDAFNGYDFNVLSPLLKRRTERKELDLFTHTTMNIRKKK